MVFRLLYVCVGVGTFVYEFENKAQGTVWLQEVDNIKKVISQIHAGFKGEREGTLDDYRGWLPMVWSLRQQFGADKVPVDIRHSLKTVESGCGLPVTEFPPHPPAVN